MTVLEKRPQVQEPVRREERPPPEPVTTRPVRWIAWTFSIIILAGAAIAAVLLTRDTTEPFESIYEAESGLSYGAVHEPGFDVGFRWVGASDMTLEEFEMFQAYEASTGEADRILERYIPAGAGFMPRQLDALQASVGEADRVLERYFPRGSTFTPHELEALQASVGAADLKYLNMATIG